MKLQRIVYSNQNGVKMECVGHVLGNSGDPAHSNHVHVSFRPLAGTNALHRSEIEWIEDVPEGTRVLLPRPLAKNKSPEMHIHPDARGNDPAVEYDPETAARTLARE